MKSLVRGVLASLCLFGASAGSVPVFAQDEARTPQSVAMDLFGFARSAMRAGDYESARRALEATLALKPGHPAVLNGLLTIGVRDNDMELVFDTLDRMAEAGLYVDLSTGFDEVRLTDPERFDAVAAALRAHQRPAGSAEIFARVDLRDELIESVAVDIETDRAFLSSVTGRQIWMLEPFDRASPILFADEADGLGSVFGMRVDDRNRLLWVTTGVVDQTPLREGETAQTVGTALVAFDLVTGELYRRYTIEDAVQMADLVVRDGMVFVSDARSPRIYVLDELGGQLRVLAEDARMVNPQGLALARAALYVADYSTGIWRVDLGDQSVSLVHARGHSLIGIDGLLNDRDGRVYAVRNGARPHQVMELVLDDIGRHIEETRVVLRGHASMTEGTEPTLIDLHDGRAWLLANAAWPLFPADGSDPERARPQTVVLEWTLD
ncbi:L-dopachrome tautomerase-related protein [Maricaulis sp. D1M11]|uniref:L-dopachrome tautomerase-related protein n=1 Tax=Maricaulis sp. D1M11 TaxID=3076117 RepID=UPI0039B42326